MRVDVTSYEAVRDDSNSGSYTLVPNTPVNSGIVSFSTSPLVCFQPAVFSPQIGTTALSALLTAFSLCHLVAAAPVHPLSVLRTCRVVDKKMKAAFINCVI